MTKNNSSDSNIDKDIKLPQDFYSDLGLEPKGQPDLSGAFADIEKRALDDSEENLADEEFMANTLEALSAARASLGKASAMASQEAENLNTDLKGEKADLKTEEVSPTRTDQQKLETDKDVAKPNINKDVKEQKDPQKPIMADAKVYSLRDKFRALRRYFIFSILLNIILIIAVIILAILLYRSGPANSKLSPIKEQGKNTSITSDEQETSKAQEDQDNLKGKATDAPDKKPAANAEATIINKTTNSKATKNTNKGTTKKTTAEKTSKVTTARETQAPTTEAATSPTTQSATTASPSKTRSTKEPSTKQTSPAKAEGSKTTLPKETTPSDPLEKAVYQASQLSLAELSEEALNLNFYTVSANPDDYINDLLVAGGKVTNIYPEGILIMEDYRPGGLTYYHAPWFIRFEDADKLGIDVGAVVNFYGIFEGYETYQANNSGLALVLEGVEFDLVH